MLAKPLTAAKALLQTMLLTMVVSFNTYGNEPQNPQVLLEQVANATFARIEQEKQQIATDPNHLRSIMEQELMPHVDHRFAAFKVLGKHFRTVPKDKLPEFVSEFRQYLVSNFAVALASYDGQEVLFQPIQDIGKGKEMSVKAIIRESGRPDINITFKLRKSKKTQQWKTYDLVAEGISLLSSKRNEFSSLIRQQGIQAAIDAMKNKNGEELTVAARN
ncbi:ABC transporter substrate-binding protein [Aliiglaciecola sp.]|nr:ABC transporter substrate-binding protein [Aliiglaciecola sp.]